MCKEALTTSQVLVHYDTTCPLKMAADASCYGVRAVISHVLADGSELPIVFASRTLTASKRNYSQLEKKALAWCLDLRSFTFTCMGAISLWSLTISPCYPFWVQRRVFRHWLLLDFNVGQFSCLLTAMMWSSSPHTTTATPMNCQGFHYRRKSVLSVLQNQVFSTSVRLRLCLWQLFGKPPGRTQFSARCFDTADRVGLASCPRHWSPFPTIEHGYLMWGMRAIKVLARSHAERAA